MEIRLRLPERFKRMEELANDLYFSWNRGIRGFFRHLDERAWQESGHNPKVFLRRVSQQRLERAATDPILFAEFRRVLSVYDTYIEEHPHTRIDRYLDPRRDLVAYFSAEFGFHQSMPIYAGGLGILAADYLQGNEQSLGPVRRRRVALSPGLFHPTSARRRRAAGGIPI